jgi:hypothetical protein
MALGVAGGDQPAHRVADEHHQRAGMLLARQLHDLVQVVDHLLEVLDQHALAPGLAVADVVGTHDHGSAVHQRRGHVLVAADVLAVAVDQHDDALRLGIGPDADADPVAEHRALAHDAAS